MDKLKYFLPLLMFAALGFFLMSGIGRDPEELPSPLIGKQVPVFFLPELSSGELLDSSALKGKVVLLNVWATWCVSCRIEHPYLLELQQQGVAIVGLNYKDDSVAARDWLKTLGNPYQLNLADTEGRLGLDLGVFGAPETFLIDREGIIRYKHVGVMDARSWADIEPLYRQLHD